MNSRLVILIVLAFAAAFGTVYLARNWMDAERASMTQSPAPAPEAANNEILVAKEDLPAGTLLQPDQMRWQAWPDAGLAPTYLVKGKRKPEDMTGAVVRQGVTAGQPITDAVVVKPGESGFLAAVLKPDMRAISVSIDATTGASGFIFPGDRVDVILTQNIQEGQENKTTRHASETVLNNVRVIAVDQTTNDQNDKAVVAKNVTLEVTPKQVEVVTLVAELGKLSLSLRSMVRNEDGSSDEKDAKDEKGESSTQVAERHSYTWDSEASVLLGPQHNEAAINVLHGDKAETQDLRSTK